ncbi:MAG TPA: amidohydrolase family protein [Acidobacteriaceae bacterium]|nr:amidohydrolase family protein [Acidobacteriaceae bacterium]
MSHRISRRKWITGAALLAHNVTGRPLERVTNAFADVSTVAGRPEGVLIESHIHLFAGDPLRFPYNSASYKPTREPVEQYVKFAREVRLDHAVIVHPEPYQDDHRYLEYCLAHGPSPGFFKGTCLFDPIDPATPKRMQALVEKHPGKIVALRIHEIHPAGTPSTTSGLIRDRDLKNPQMAVTWRAAHELGLAIQIHCIPHYAGPIGELAGEFRETPVILDHLARPGQGTPHEYEQVLKLARLQHVYMKFSKTGVESASKQPFPHLDAKPLVRQVYEAYGPDKIVWGELGANLAEFQKAVQLFNLMFDFVPEANRMKIRGLTSQKLFAFS